MLTFSPHLPSTSHNKRKICHGHIYKRVNETFTIHSLQVCLPVASVFNGKQVLQSRDEEQTREGPYDCGTGLTSPDIG